MNTLKIYTPKAANGKEIKILVEQKRTKRLTLPARQIRLKETTWYLEMMSCSN